MLNQVRNNPEEHEWRMARSGENDERQQEMSDRTRIIQTREDLDDVRSGADEDHRPGRLDTYPPWEPG